MAEVFQYRSGSPSFSEVLEIISRWSDRQNLSGSEIELAKGELESCLESLKDKTDGMSGMVRSRIGNLLSSLDCGGESKAG